jgi:NitT/TauT family transport system permease protein
MGKYWAASILMFLVLLLAWEWAASADAAIRFFTGSPSLIARQFSELVVDEQFRRSFFVTGFEAFVGLIIGATVGSVSGLLAFRFRRIAPLVAPLILGIGSIPVLAFAPLMIVWFGIGLTMKVALAAITTFFVSFAQALRGAQSMSAEQLDIFRAMRATESQMFWKAIVPGSLSWVLGSMRLNAGFCLLGAFVGEFISSDQGLGYTILRASSLYDMPRALAASVGILMLGLAFDFVARFVEWNKDTIAQVLSVPILLRRPQKFGLSRSHKALLKM